MIELIDALPGVELPVEAVTKRLETMWEGESSPDSPSEFRASQMNVILHFGLDVTPEQARERFATVIAFAQRYPSRIIVLCPTREDDLMMTAKLFSQCYIGVSHREKCCCEALMLRYKPENFGYLANQVSIWLEGDLPTYHWFSGVPGHRIERYFDNLLVGVRRIVYDSSIEGEDLSQLDWPAPERVHDLARARLLPIRQSIGQFLSSYAMSSLCDGLQRIRFTYAPEWSGEALRLKEWIEACLCDCGDCGDCGDCATDAADASSGPQLELLACDAADSECALTMDWSYSDDRFLHWRKFSDGARSEIEVNFGKVNERIPMRVKPLLGEQALAEALFF